MAFLNESFDIDSLPQGTSYDPLPPGWYGAVIAGADLKNTKAGNGQYIAVRYDITGPTHQGRVVYGNINIRNPNPKAEEIGRQQLGEIMRAIGLPRVTDTDQLLGGNLQIKLDIRQQDGYEPTNDVKGFKAAGGSMSSVPTKAAAPKAPKAAPASAPAESDDEEPAPAASSKAAPPWAKK